jgi:hypothetical protein
VQFNLKTCNSKKLAIQTCNSNKLAIEYTVRTVFGQTCN